MRGGELDEHEVEAKRRSIGMERRREQITYRGGGMD